MFRARFEDLQGAYREREFGDAYPSGELTTGFWHELTEKLRDLAGGVHAANRRRRAIVWAGLARDVTWARARVRCSALRICGRLSVRDGGAPSHGH